MFICLGKTPILLAAWMDNTTIIQHLIDHGAQVTDTDFAGRNMLHYSQNNTEIIKQFPFLINKGNCRGKSTIILHFRFLKGKMIYTKYVVETLKNYISKTLIQENKWSHQLYASSEFKFKFLSVYIGVLYHTKTDLKN